MNYEVDMAEQSSINLLARGIDEILQNVRMILSTPKGSVPLNRQFGIDMSSLDKPIEIIENVFTAAIIEAIQASEPRVLVEKVSYYNDHQTGKVIPKVRIKIDA